MWRGKNNRLRSGPHGQWLWQGQAPDSQFPMCQVAPDEREERVRSTDSSAFTMRQPDPRAMARKYCSDGSRLGWKVKGFRPPPAIQIPSITLGKSLPSLCFSISKKATMKTALSSSYGGHRSSMTPWIPQNTGFSKSHGGKAEWYPGSLPRLRALSAYPLLSRKLHSPTMPRQVPTGVFQVNNDDNI